MKYRFEGPVPVADDAGELVHPLDVRAFDAEPDCPPWLPLEEPEAEAPADPPPAPAITPAVPVTPEGM